MLSFLNFTRCIIAASHRMLSLTSGQRCFKPPSSESATYFEVHLTPHFIIACVQHVHQTFGIDSFSIKLSVNTTDNLEPELRVIKQSSPLRMLVGFENANIFMDNFHFERPSAKLPVLLECLQQHYGQQFLSQAYKIIGWYVAQASSCRHACKYRRC